MPKTTKRKSVSETEKMITRSKTQKTEKEDPSKEREDQPEESDYNENSDQELTPFEVFMNSQPVKKMLNDYKIELLLVDETPEEKKEREENPDMPIVSMRNTTSKNINERLFEF